ncbi:MAG: hypothetical protein Q9201_004277 [Fulgogasparrea decipioides]
MAEWVGEGSLVPWNTSIVVEALAQIPTSRDYAFAFMYCNYKERAQQTFENLISSLIRQLVDRDSSIPDELRLLYQSHKKHETRPNRSELLRLLNTVASGYASLFFVIDALDEFLLAQLHVGALATKHTRKAIRSALQTLPVELDNTYDETLRRINDQTREDVSLAMNVLLWVFHASTPLTAVELQHAIATMSLDGETELDEDDLPDVDILISVCAGIVVIDSESNVARLVHYTTQEYLERNPIILPSVAQARITETCIAYLSLPPFKEGPCDDDRALLERLERYPFIGYAALNWGDHARGRPEDDCREIILAFLSHEDLRASARQASSVAPYYPEAVQWVHRFEPYHTGVSSLATAAAFGLTDIVKYLLREGLDVDAVDDIGTTALMYSADAGHIDTIKALLEAGADTNKSDASGNTALLAATRKELNPIDEYLSRAIGGGNTEMVDLILNKADEIKESDAITSSLLNSFHYKRPSTENLEVLIRKGASLTAFDDCGNTPIHKAAQTGHVDAVRLFLNQGVASNLRSKEGDTPLHWATSRGSLEMIDLLLDHGADITTRNDAGETALHTCLHYESHDDVIQFLVRQGVPLDKTDAQGRTALHQAARRGYASIVKTLVEHGADVDVENELGWIPLQDAAASGQETVVEQLLKHMVIPRSPVLTELITGARLRAAVARDDYHVVQELLMKPEIDVTIPDQDGRTALHHAAYRGQKETVRSLLERGASVHARIADSRYIFVSEPFNILIEGDTECQRITPLHNAAGKGHADIVEILLSHRADIHAAGCLGKTAFSAAVIEGHANVAKMLLERGTKVSETDRDDGLYRSAMFGHEDLVRLLLENEVDEERDTERGKGALARAEMNNHAGIVELMKRHGFKTARR